MSAECSRTPTPPGRRGMFSATLLAAIGIALAGCSIPTQNLGPTATPSASSTSSAASRVATVVGTGRFGLSIRSGPGLNGERIATEPDGYQAKVIDGPVAGDGSQWYKLQGPDVTGWASGSYLKVEAGTLPPVPPAGAGTSGGSGLPSVLTGLAHDSNYSVGKSRIFVQPELQPAANHLAASPTAEALLQKAAPAYVRITVAHLASGTEGGEFATLGHSIKIADSIMTESVDVQSTVLSHELQHASDILVDHMAPDSAQSCVNLELRAFQTQEKVWLELTKPSPARTTMESELDQLSHLVNTPAFAQKLGQLYAGECNVYNKG